MVKTDETVFCTIISVNQLSISTEQSHGVCHARTGKPVLAEQSDPLFEPARLLRVNPTPSTEVPAQENLLQTYKERVERLSQHISIDQNLY